MEWIKWMEEVSLERERPLVLWDHLQLWEWVDTQPSIHAVELSTSYTVILGAQLWALCGVCVSAPCENVGLLEMMSLQPGESLGCDSQGEVKIIVRQPMWAALINPSLSESPLDFKMRWTLSVLMWPFLGRRLHSLIGSGIWPKPAGLSVTVPAPLSVGWLLGQMG